MGRVCVVADRAHLVRENMANVCGRSQTPHSHNPDVMASMAALSPLTSTLLFSVTVPRHGFVFATCVFQRQEVIALGNATAGICLYSLRTGHILRRLPYMASSLCTSPNEQNLLAATESGIHEFHVAASRMTPFRSLKCGGANPKVVTCNDTTIGVVASHSFKSYIYLFDYSSGHRQRRVRVYLKGYAIRSAHFTCSSSPVMSVVSTMNRYGTYDTLSNKVAVTGRWSSWIDRHAEPLSGVDDALVVSGARSFQISLQTKRGLCGINTAKDAAIMPGQGFSVSRSGDWLSVWDLDYQPPGTDVPTVIVGVYHMHTMRTSWLCVCALFGR